MAIEILMPALSPTMEEGTLAKWLVKEGDTVSSGDILAEIETDKATMEFEAVDEGVIGAIVVPEGTEGVKVGTVIAVIGDAGTVTAPAQAGAYLARRPIRTDVMSTSLRWCDGFSGDDAPVTGVLSLQTYTQNAVFL